MSFIDTGQSSSSDCIALCQSLNSLIIMQLRAGPPRAVQCAHHGSIAIARNQEVLPWWTCGAELGRANVLMNAVTP